MLFEQKPTYVPLRIQNAWMKLGPFDFDKALQLTKVNLDLDIQFYQAEEFKDDNNKSFIEDGQWKVNEKSLYDCGRIQYDNRLFEGIRVFKKIGELDYSYVR